MKKSICLIAAVLFMAAGQGFGSTDFKDGGTHNIDYTINNDVWVDYLAPGMQTTVNLLNGGYISQGRQLQAFEDGRVNIFGGAVGECLNAFGSSHVTISGGSVGYMYTYGGSQLTISGGSVDTFLMTYGGSQLTMSGGMVGGDVYAWDSSHVTISGGSLDACLNTYNTSRVTISDGSILADLNGRGQSQITMYGGIIGRDIKLESEAILTIDGSGFAIDGKPFGYGEITSILGGDYSGESFRTLTGTLANGDIINNQFRIGDSSSIVLTPEPATLLLLGLGGLALRRKK